MSINSDPAARGWAEDRRNAAFQQGLVVFGHEAARRFVAAGLPPEGVLAEEPPPRPERPRRRLFQRTPPAPPWPAPIFRGWSVLAAQPQTHELRTGGYNEAVAGRPDGDSYGERVTSSTGLFVTTQGECRLVSSCARGEALPGDEDELERYHVLAPGELTADRLVALYGFASRTQDQVRHLSPVDPRVRAAVEFDAQEDARMSAQILDFLAAGVEMTTRGQDRFG
ncbi:hypothetical protein [Cryptosporangium arvum]|uniref:hypothetical protein n=1 Tax=Cryptosporangium arvum TaxID=80871 RepID=UPI0004B81D18|nr:hypothetical protein [Cryptosporangium arvum]